MVAGEKTGALVLAGAIAGGIAGYFAFRWMLTQGFYALVLPGGLVGLGAGIFTSRSRAVPIVCGLLAFALGVYSEWRTAPFIVDGRFGYFLMPLQQLRPLTMILIAVTKKTLVENQNPTWSRWSSRGTHRAEASSTGPMGRSRLSRE